MEIPQRQILKYFESVKDKLLNPSNVFPIQEVRKKMGRNIGAGVYFIFDKGVLCYVGESGNLLGRISEFNRTYNHTFRRSLAESKFSSNAFYEKARPGMKFNDKIESLINEYVLPNSCSKSALIIAGGLVEIAASQTSIAPP